MNEPQPGAASVPVSEEDQDKAPTTPETPVPEPVRAQDEGDGEFGDDQDDDREEGDEYDDEGDERPRRREARPAAEPAPPPVSFADVVSGEFDQQAAAAEAAPPKRVLAPQLETLKLHKVLA